MKISILLGKVVGLIRLTLASWMRYKLSNGCILYLLFFGGGEAVVVWVGCSGNVCQNVDEKAMTLPQG